MSTSIFLAQAFGIYFAIMTVALLVNHASIVKIVNETPPTSFVTFLAGIFTVILGIVLVLFHNVWVPHWPVVITILAWVTLIKGVMLIVYPNYIDWAKKYIFNTKLYSMYWIFTLVLAVFFLCKGFWY